MPLCVIIQFHPDPTSKRNVGIIGSTTVTLYQEWTGKEEVREGLKKKAPRCLKREVSKNSSSIVNFMLYKVTQTPPTL